MIINDLFTNKKPSVAEDANMNYIWIQGDFDGDTASTGPTQGSWRDQQVTPVKLTRGRMSNVRPLSGPPPEGGKTIKQAQIPLTLDAGDQKFSTTGVDLQLTMAPNGYVTNGEVGRVRGTAVVKIMRPESVEEDLTRRGFLQGLGAAALAGAAGGALAGSNDPSFVRKVHDQHNVMIEKNPRYAKEHDALGIYIARGILGASAENNKRWVEKTAKLLQKYGVNINEGMTERMDGQVVFSGTSSNGGKYEIIQSGPTDFMIHANGKHIDTYGSLQRAMSVLKNEVQGLQKGMAEDIGDLGYNVVRYYEKTQEVKKLTNWLEKEAGLPRNSPLYFDDVDLVYGNKTIVPGALINPKLTFNDLLTAVVQASKQGMAEATGDEKFDTMMGQIQREPKYPDSQMPPTDVKDLYDWAVENNKLYHEIFAEWANREGYKSVAPALQRAGDLDTEALDYWTPRVWKIYWGEVRGIDSEMPPEWAKKRVPDELRDYLETVFDAYNRIVFDWPTEYRQIGQQGMAEGSGPVTHRIGLTVTDPNHPMVSKRKEPYQKSVRVTQDVPDREAAINQAIAHHRRKGYKVHDHHYIGTVDDEPVNELSKDTIKNYVKAQPARIKGPAGLATTNPKKAARIVDTEKGDIRRALTKFKDPGYGKQQPTLDEVSLGDYRKKAAVSQAGAKINKFFGRDDPATVAAADQTIANRTKGLARAAARTQPYTPPKFDAEKYQRDLTAKYPNIDELVADAERRRDQHYDRAEGNAYYNGRDAEQNYQKLKQIQRVIQGLNESQDDTKKKELGTGTGNINPDTGRPWLPSELKAKYADFDFDKEATKADLARMRDQAKQEKLKDKLKASLDDPRDTARDLAKSFLNKGGLGADFTPPEPTPTPVTVKGQPPGFTANNLAQQPGMAQYMQQKPVAPRPVPNFAQGPAGYKTTTTTVAPTTTKTTAAAAPAGKKPTARQQQEYYKSLGLSEDLTWSRNFNPGRSLYRQIKQDR